MHINDKKKRKTEEEKKLNTLNLAWIPFIGMRFVAFRALTAPCRGGDPSSHSHDVGVLKKDVLRDVKTNVKNKEIWPK